MSKLPTYFKVYGGFNAIASSPYFWTSVAISVVCAKYFLQPGWWDLVLDVVPGLVGFSIAGVAIFVSLGSDKLRASIAGKEAGSEETSPFIDFMAMFTHFIVVQLLALILAILSKSIFDSPASGPAELIDIVNSFKSPTWFFGGLLFIYAAMLCVALAAEIYRLAEIIDDFQTSENKK